MQLRLVVSRDSPLARRKLTMQQLSTQQFITLGEQSHMHKILLDACRKAGFRPNIAIRSNDMKYYEKLVDSGIGIGLERNNPKSLRQRNIAYLDVFDFLEESVVFAYYRKEAAYGNLEQFLQFLCDQLRITRIKCLGIGTFLPPQHFFRQDPIHGDPQQALFPAPPIFKFPGYRFFFFSFFHNHPPVE